jgi:hypothetical protein
MFLVAGIFKQKARMMVAYKYFQFSVTPKIMRHLWTLARTDRLGALIDSFLKLSQLCSFLSRTRWDCITPSRQTFFVMSVLNIFLQFPSIWTAVFSWCNSTKQRNGKAISKYKSITTNALLLFSMFLRHNILFQHVSIPVGIILSNVFKS